MKTFRINYTEIQKGFVEVEAESKEAAEEMYLDLYNEGQVHWTYSSITEAVAEEVAA